MNEKGEGVRGFLRESLREYSLLLIILVTVFTFQFTTRGIFLSSRNLGLLMLQASVLGLVTNGIVCIIITRNFDLSVGSVLSFIAALAAILDVLKHVPPIITFIIVLAVGICIAAYQAFFITKFKIQNIS